MIEAQNAEVELGAVLPAVFHMFMTWLYTGTLGVTRMTWRELCDLTGLAHRYDVEGLLRLCAYLLKTNLRANTAAQTLEMADRFQMLDLKSESIDFLLANPDATDTDAWATLASPLHQEVAEAAISGRARKRRRISGSFLQAHVGTL